jgi:hypothetical protein
VSGSVDHNCQFKVEAREVRKQHAACDAHAHAHAHAHTHTRTHAQKCGIKSVPVSRGEVKRGAL